ncbi:hypothetical protein HJC10_26255 [Corallococcus exiguus]|nr:hypothetical protein [Corallococcus exiguus]
MGTWERGLPALKQVSIPSLAPLREVGSAAFALSDLDQLGTPNFEGKDVEASIKTWWIEAQCSLEFALSHDFLTGEARVIAEETAEFEHALAHLSFSAEEPFQMGPSSEERTRRDGNGGWRVLRIDTHGGTFEVTSFSRERSARCFADLLEHRGHKQGYFVEPQDPLPPLPSRGPGPMHWVLLRQDENGVRYEIARAPWRSQLEWLAEQYNKEPRHKQLWFVESLPPVTPAATSADR